MRPHLLLDIDGVLCPWGWLTPPEGFREYIPEAQVYVSESNTHRLASLQEHFDFVWCTAWEADANLTIGPVHELDPLPVIEFGTRRVGHRIFLPESVHSGLSFTSTWKLPWVVEWAEDKGPLAWIDDDLGEDAFEWADAREDSTKLCLTDCAVGLTDAIVASLIEFAQGVSINGASLRDG